MHIVRCCLHGEDLDPGLGGGCACNQDRRSLDEIFAVDSREDVRQALVAAVRTLRERALINRGMAQRIDVTPLYAQRYLREAEDAERQAAIVDRLLDQLVPRMDDTAPKHRRAG